MADWTDGSVYPGTGVLVNKRGVRDQAVLTRIEHRVVQDGERSLRLTDGELLTPAAIARTHGHLFGALYGWAGRHRTVEISKGGTHFLPADRIGTGLAYACGELEAAAPLGVLRELGAASRGDPPAAADRLARLLAGPVAELNYVHPFREGNGRALRAYVDQIASRAALRLDSSRIERLAWIQASKRSAADPSETLGIRNQLRFALVPRHQPPGDAPPGGGGRRDATGLDRPERAPQDRRPPTHGDPPP